MDALRAYLRRVDAGLGPADRAAREVREAERVGVAIESWQGLRDDPMDLAQLRGVHQAVSGHQTHVRRAKRDGQWALAVARPGLLRTTPQSFRVGGHVEAAWEPGALKGGLIRLLEELAPGFEAEPVRRGAHLLWGLSRAQPFAGKNERAALVLLSLALRQAGLPALPASALEHDPALVAALVAARVDDRSALERSLERAVWHEALAHAEWVPPPPGDPTCWNLRAEHERLIAARQSARGLARPDLHAVAARAAALLAPALSSRLGFGLLHHDARWVDAFPERLQLARDSAVRGRRICPHESIRIHRWAVGDLGLWASLIVASAGRGDTGAASMHVAIELPEVPVAGNAPAILLVPDEAGSECDARAAAWIAPAVDDAMRRCPMRL